MYPSDKRPEFWAFIAEQIENGTVGSTKKVYDELLKGQDYLKTWTKSRKALCKRPSRAVQDAYRRIADFARANYPMRLWDEFLDGGDAWIIASALSEGGGVVTEESTWRNGKIRIPSVCKSFDVRCTNVVGMLAELEAPF
jgi:hypothetical protein